MRLCADDVLTREKLVTYHDSYAKAMEKYGLQRGVRGSEAHHTTTAQYYRDLKRQTDARFCASERSPSKDRQAEVTRCGINSIKTSMQFELLSDSPFLSLSDHVESELLIDSVIAKGIRLRDDAPVGGNRSKAEIIRTFSMSLNDVNKFSKTRTARKLSEDKHIKMIPMSKTPVISSIIMPTDNTIELTFKPISDLIEYELPRMHNCSNLNLDAKVSISNVGQVFLELLHCA